MLGLYLKPAIRKWDSVTDWSSSPGGMDFSKPRWTTLCTCALDSKAAVSFDTPPASTIIHVTGSRISDKVRIRPVNPQLTSYVQLFDSTFEGLINLTKQQHAQTATGGYISCTWDELRIWCLRHIWKVGKAILYTFWNFGTGRAHGSPCSCCSKAPKQLAVNDGMFRGLCMDGPIIHVHGSNESGWHGPNYLLYILKV